MADRRPALGKGLSALIPDVPEPPPAAPGSLEVDIDLLQPNDLQPRRQIDADRLAELTQSIRAHGIIQPIIVRRLDEGRFQIIAGERRWRAAQHAGLLRVPVAIKDITSPETQRRLEMALIENLQREDLNPIEEAFAYQRLMREFSVSQEEVATKVGKDRSSVANTLRLLRLPEEVRAAVAAGSLSMGHARALVSIGNEAEQRRIARDVMARQLSVRQAEAIAKKANDASAAKTPTTTSVKKDVHTRAAEEQLRLSLGTEVIIRRRGKRGVLAIAFANEEELHRLYERLTERR